MLNVIIKYLNLALLGLCLFFAVAAAFVWLLRPSIIEEKIPKVTPIALPKSPFQQTAPATACLGDTVLQCKFQPPTIKLPDLKNILIFYGKNGRPDADNDKPQLHFSLAGGKGFAGLLPGEKLYLVFNRKNDGSKYAFSPNNEETPLWIESKLTGTEAFVTVHLIDDKGDEVVEPDNNRKFALLEKEFIRNNQSPWEMGKWRVDATLLARMRARWYGPDKFLEEHGGDEYKIAVGKQRIDFGEGEDAYSVYVKVGDTLVYLKDKWQFIEPGPESLTHPLLVVKKVDERLMNLELWDTQGKGKVALNLLKSSENFQHENFIESFKFLGARTRSQFLFEIDAERMLIRPHDWLVLTEEGWKKLSTVDDIDSYVNRKMVGTLFVFDKISRKDDKQIMQGTVYNPNRTESYQVEIAMQPAAIPGLKKGDEKSSEEVASKKRVHNIEPPSYAKHK